jgi:hypothetical protein
MCSDLREMPQSPLSATLGEQQGQLYGFTQAVSARTALDSYLRYRYILQGIVDDLNHHVLVNENTVFDELNKFSRHLLYQFSYYYTRMYSAVSERLIPEVIYYLHGKNISSMTLVDRIHTIEQLAWTESGENSINGYAVRDKLVQFYSRYAELCTEQLHASVLSITTLFELIDDLEKGIYSR